MMSPFRCVVFLCCLALVVTQNPACVPVMKLYKGKSYPADDVPSSPVDNAGLQICASGKAKHCCTRQMERNFEALSRGDFERVVWDKTDNLLVKGLFSKRHKEFDDHFASLIANSRKNLDSMFKSTYTSHYSQNKKVFMDFFDELEGYYNDGKNIDLEQLVQEFFETVMIKMFEIVTSQTYSADFTGCLTKRMDELKAFGDVPAQLKTQIKKSFVIARTFTQALEVGRDVATELGKISATVECQKHLVKMSYCSWCKPQYVSLKPCNAYCVDVYKHCLYDLEQVDPYWDAYLKALVDITPKFVGPMSIENVLGELHMKISTGIMSFQERLFKDSSKIAQNCQKGSGKRRRSLESSSDFFLDDTSRERRETPGVHSRDERSSRSTPLERMSMEFKNQIRSATKFWSLLPDAICKMPDAAAGVRSNECWNGTAKGRYSGSKPNKIGSTMSKEISDLNVITEQLESALQGEEVNVIDPDESGTGSGSGSGSGSGENEITDITTSRPPGNENEVDDVGTNRRGAKGGDGDGNNLEARDAQNSCSHVLPSLWLICIICFVSITAYT